MNGNSNGNNGRAQMPQSWNDLVVMPPQDPRILIAAASFEDSGGSGHGAVFIRSNTFLHATTWVNPPMIVSAVTSSTTPTIQPVNAMDFDAQEQANVWNGTHAMASTNSQIPLSVQKILFARGDPKFVNNFYVDWTGGTTSSSDVELTFRDNSCTSGDFQNSGSGTIPVFSFPAASYGGTGRLLSMTLLRTGRFPMAMRLIDSSGNYSIFEFDLIAL